MDVLGVLFTAAACLIMGLMLLVADVKVDRITHRLAWTLVALSIAGPLVLVSYLLTH